jgi:DUF971 family protein
MSEFVPTRIELHQQSKTLEVHFNDGLEYVLPVEYLRVFSPSAEARIARDKGEWIVGKEAVNIKNLEPVGAYAVRILFDDGHRTGIYSWPVLRELGQDYDANWRQYLARTGRTA